VPAAPVQIHGWAVNGPCYSMFTCRKQSTTIGHKEKTSFKLFLIISVEWFCICVCRWCNWMLVDTARYHSWNCSLASVWWVVSMVQWSPVITVSTFWCI